MGLAGEGDLQMGAYALQQCRTEALILLAGEECVVTGGIGDIQQEGGDLKMVPDVGVQCCVDLPS